MIVPTLDASAAIEPIRQLIDSDQPGVLSVITGIEGPSYRPLGATMAVFADTRRVGSLSSGCVELDIALHAASALDDGKSKKILYGRGSPFVDIQLPCGGGLEVTLVPNPDLDVLKELNRRHTARQACAMVIEPDTCGLEVWDDGETGFKDGKFVVKIEPELFFYVFGKGPETTTFAGLVQSAGYPNLILSPDKETLEVARSAGCEIRHLTSANFPTELRPDSRSAVVMFFHDHEWEPPILEAALKTDAFYIGAQGSHRASQTRRQELKELGVADDMLDRVKGPIGLIPSVRDARKLAVSVLAEVLSEAYDRF
ncbi:MAG: XdhC family protein [Boseongicola sp.]